MNQVDVLVLGAGPVGLYTAYYCGLRKLSTIVCDSLESVGGQLSNLYPEKEIYDLPGFNPISAGAFIERLQSQLSAMSQYVSEKLNFKVSNIERTTDGFKVTNGSEELYAKSIILAMGNGSFSPRKMNLNGEDDCNNIHYYVSKMAAYQGKDVVVLGGGDSAIDWALMLEKVAKSVTLVHRREQFRAKESIVERLHGSSVKVMTPFVPSEIIARNNVATHLLISHSKTSEVVELKVDDILVCYGNIPTTPDLSEWGLKVENHKVLINQQSKTNRKGIFACGDICTYEGKEIQIISGLAEGMAASASAYRYIHGDQKVRPVR